MDYEQKYKNALERARKCWEEYNEIVGAFENKGVCEQIFPELKESEDEKIRKGLIALIKECLVPPTLFRFGLNKEDTAAWIEKQGEQKQELLTKEKALKNSPFVEQSPAWSEEDEKFFNTALWHICNSISNGNLTEIRCDTTEWFKSLKDRVQPQNTWKPSKGQMDALLWCVAHLGGADHRVLGELYEHLKQLMEE